MNNNKYICISNLDLKQLQCYTLMLSQGRPVLTTVTSSIGRGEQWAEPLVQTRNRTARCR